MTKYRLVIRCGVDFYTNTIESENIIEAINEYLKTFQHKFKNITAISIEKI